MGLNLATMNRLAGVAILPLMLLAILVFSRPAQRERDLPLPTTGVIVVANLRAQTLTFHNLATTRATTLALPGPPHELLEFNGRLYVTLGRADLVAEVDPSGPGTLRLLSLPGEPHGIAERGGTLLVTLDKGNAVVSIDPATFTEVGREPTGDTPHMVATSPHGAFVIDSRDNILRRLEPAAVIAPAGELPEGLAVVGDRVVTADYLSGTLSVFDAKTLEPLASVDVGPGPVRVRALDNRRVLVTVQGTPRLLVVDLIRLDVENSFEVPGRPDGICLSPGAEYAGVASNAEGIVRLLAVDSWRGAGSIPAGGGPGACLWLPSR
jgi:DNA-binding beta-propeller fold protein YncE